MEFEEIRSRLVDVLREKSLRRGRFKLTSGQVSSYYFDAKLTTLDPEGAYLTAKLILETLKREKVNVEAIGGLTLGADPIVAAVAAVSYVESERYRALPAFIARKEAKKHGTRNFLEGCQPPSGSAVAIVDDVCTTGSSTLKAVRAAEQSGLNVAAVLCLVDRRQGGGEALSDYRFIPLISADELLEQPNREAVSPGPEANGSSS